MTTHQLYTDADRNRPESICDRNGQVVLGLCKVCGQAEADLESTCPGSHPSITGDETSPARPDMSGTPVTVLDSKGRRFIALNQADAERMRADWLVSEGAERNRAELAAGWREIEARRHAAFLATRPSWWQRFMRWWHEGGAL